MNIAKVVKEELKRQHKTAKWLHEQLQDYEESGTYQWFAEKLKENKLSAVDLVYIAHILNLDLRRFTTAVKMKEFRKGTDNMQTYSPEKQLMVDNSEYKGLEGQRLFFGKDGLEFLLTYSVKEDTAVLESFDLDNEETRVFTRLVGISSIGDIPFESIQEFAALSNEDKFKALYEQGKDYQLVFPEDYNQECPIRYFNDYTEEVKKNIMVNASYSKNSGREGSKIFYFGKDNKDWLLTYNKEEDFFCLEWFDFDSRTRRVYAFEGQWSAGDLTIGFFDNFEELSDEQKFEEIKEAAKDYHYYSREEYNAVYPVFSF